MAITPLERPGVKVYQRFRTATPVFGRPLMPASIIGPCHQVIEAVQDDGSLNDNARITTPARLIADWVTGAGSPMTWEYTGVGGDSLVVRVNNAAPRTATFGGSGNRSPEELASDINAALIPGITAIVERSGNDKRLVVLTTNVGDLTSIQVVTGTSSDVLTAFGIRIGQIFVGTSGYMNFLDLRVGRENYPNPRDNIDLLDIDYESVRVFQNDGAGNIREVLRTESFLQGATSAVTAPTDGDGDNLTPYLDFVGADFSAAPAPAQATGNANVTTLTYATDVQGRTLVMSIDGEPWQTIVFGAGVTNQATLVSAIEALWGAGVAAASGNFLELNSLLTDGGVESSIRIDKTLSDATLLTNLGLTGAGAPFDTVSVVYGDPYAPEVGDEVWVDGLRIGEIVEIPVSPTNRLRVDSERLLTFTGATWYIVAKNLDNNGPTASRPSSNLIVDDNTGLITIKQDLYRDTAGNPTSAGPLATYVAYDALRLDVTPASGTSFQLLRYGSTTALEEDLSPVDPQNPLALGMYFALLNAPAYEVTGLGVDETSDSAPEGTADSYVRSFEFLESKDVYAIAPLTHDPVVGQVGQVHVNAMSDPEMGGERILLFTPRRPSRLSDTVVASGTRANVSGPPTNVISTGIANLQALLAAAGAPGPVYTIDDNVFIEFEDDANHYLVESVSSGFVTIADGPLTGNTDGFYLDGGGSPVFTEIVVDRPFVIKIRGAEVANLTEEANAYGEIGQGFSDRRVLAIVPDTAIATIDGLEQSIPGYYLGAALAGRISSKQPQQPLTESSIAGFTGLIGSSDRYGEGQLRIISGGGMFVFYHEQTPGTPVLIRQQLSTDMTSVDTRELSITTALDAFAKIVRSSFRNFIGGYNITQNLIEQLSVAADGLKRYVLESQRLFSDLTWGSFTQPSEEPDSLQVDAVVTTLKPANKIRVTIIV